MNLMTICYTLSYVSDHNAVSITTRVFTVAGLLETIINQCYHPHLFHGENLSMSIVIQACICNLALFLIGWIL